MKKKSMLIVVGILLVLVAVGTILLPKRIRLYNEIKNNIDGLGPKGEMFDAFDVTDDSLVQIDTSNLTIGVPKDFIQGDNEIIVTYKSADESQLVGVSKHVSDEPIAFFMPGYGENSQIFGIEYSFDDLRKGFEKLGYGIPDNTYNTYKCMYLLKEKDYSFWDYEKGLAYANAAFVKGETMMMDTNYVYEREDMYALIMERNLVDEGMLHFYVEVFDPDDLNTSYLVVVKVKDRQQAYAIINSIKMK